MSIQVSNLTKIYGAQRAVDGISFKAEKGEIVGFLGPNGAGKSTTMKIITGYLSPDGGTATVCGIDVKAAPLETKKKIGYLPESNPLYYDMYVREYLAFIAGVHKIQEPARKIESVIETVGLTPESKKKIGQLSKGYKQRVGLAAALLHDPEVLILDEPTTGLDPNQIIEIREVIKRLGKEKTIVFSSHILQEVEAICDRVVIINKGKLVADSNLADLRNNMQQRQAISVRFKEKADRNLLESMPGVKAVRSVDDYSWELESDDAAGLRRSLMELALQQNWNIESLQAGEQSLEAIFRELTVVP